MCLKPVWFTPYNDYSTVIMKSTYLPAKRHKYCTVQLAPAVNNTSNMLQSYVMQACTVFLCIDKECYSWIFLPSFYIQ